MSTRPVEPSFDALIGAGVSIRGGGGAVGFGSSPVSCPGISVGGRGDTIELCLAALASARTPVVRGTVPIGGCLSASARRVID